MATSAGATRPADQITFAHNSERQFARLLDFYRVEWEYEPTAFPIEWDAAGRPLQHFRPDFYLPGFCLYIEITTINQRLVTKKNRKVRRLRELYPAKPSSTGRGSVSMPRRRSCRRISCRSSA